MQKHQENYKGNYKENHKEKYSKILITMFQDADNLLFYKIMKYPVPKKYHYFLTKKSQTTNFNKETDNTFSRRQPTTIHNEYTKHIQKYKKLYKSLPFVEEIYLCNSLSFNGLREGSDIDLFIITQAWALRRARFFSVFLFFLHWILRKWKSKKKFCLSFYITNKAKNLYNISLDKTDIYLAYWITHLYPLYQQNPQDKQNIYQHNNRIKQILPNTSSQQKINLNIETSTGDTFFKKILEFVFSWVFWKLIEWSIKSIRLPLVITKKKTLGEKGIWIIISKNMLKFYHDKRKKIRFLYQLEKKKVWQ